ncbi:Glycosidase [Caloramator quimbayensis]|uniref:Glycosidase n=1 Tax=Caloramator quimbayensis TaxID=1147123 RepID=A0A1T4XFX9_9CLOT|nr:glycoside hydrolase family 13 protein [Caloramator quimbayensis]SKA87991.1 Glycosidase [Caloramator quimbayensis]
MTDEIIYQIFPDRFYNGDRNNDPKGVQPWNNNVDRDSFLGGDLKGILDKLSYLEELGTTVIYLNPIFQSPSNHKYDTENYFKIDENFGDNEMFKNFVKECHKRNIKVIIDGVFNHTGTKFFAFKDLLEKQQFSCYKNWYDVFSFPVNEQGEVSYRACGGAAFLPKLNTENKEVQDYIIKVIKYWESYGIDGLRLDVPFEMHISMLKRIRECTDLFIIGEIWGLGGRYVPKYFDSVTNYYFRELIRKAVANQCLDGAMFIDEWNIIENQYGKHIYNQINLAGSHDTERISTLCGKNTKKINLFFALLFLLPGIPLIYYGDEIGMEGSNDPYCRGGMEWDKEKWNYEILNNIKKLIKLRKEHIELRRGKLKFVSSKDRMICFERCYENSIIKVFVNFGFQKDCIEGKILEPLSYEIEKY